MKKTVLIFGAGASNDNGLSIEHQMPLSKYLFDEKNIPSVQKALENFPGTVIKNQLSFIKKGVMENEGNVEQYLEKLQQENPVLAVHILWYLQDITLSTESVSQSDNYLQFLHALWRYQRKEALHISDIINFNYDLLLDKTVTSELGLSTDILEYINRPEEKGKTQRYIKPHGSANWYYKTDIQGKDFSGYHSGEECKKAKINATLQLMQTQRTRDESGIIIGSKSRIKSLQESDHAMIPEPALIPPIIGKSIAGKFPLLAKAMEEAIIEADHIILIGYGGKDNDFQDCIQKRADTGKPTEISAIGNNAPRTIRRVNEICKNRNAFTPGFIFTEGFSKAVWQVENDKIVIVDGILKIPNFL